MCAAFSAVRLAWGTNPGMALNTHISPNCIEHVQEGRGAMGVCPQMGLPSDTSHHLAPAEIARSLGVGRKRGADTQHGKQQTGVQQLGTVS